MVKAKERGGKVEGKARANAYSVGAKGLRWYVRLGPEHESRRGGRKREVLGRRRVVEWKLKRRKAFLLAPNPVLPEDCCVVIEWTDATRARSQHQWETGKKVGSGGEWALLAVR